MRRKTVWHPKAATSSSARSVPNLSGSPHAHQCTTCQQRYEDACRTHHEDGSCASCRGGLEMPIWRSNRLPQTCCRTDSRPATKDERQTYKLAGQAEWWICEQCSRTHPYPPEQEMR